MIRPVDHDQQSLGTQIDSGTMIPDLLSRYPQARPVFDRYGLNGCGGRLGPVEPIGINHAFTSISLFQVNAHGHAQIFGWVGLFIMGFAYQAFPRMWHTPLAGPRWAAAAFILMLVGLSMQVTAMTLTESWSQAIPTAVIGNLLQILAILIFATQLILTHDQAAKPQNVLVPLNIRVSHAS